MKHFQKRILALLALAVLAMLGGPASAQILSYSTFISTGTFMPLGGPNSGNVEQREIGFTMGSTSYSLTSVTLPLAFASGLTSTSFTLTLYGYSSASNSGASATPLTTAVFTNPVFSYTTTNAFAPAYATYMFTTPSATTLTAGMTYWLVLTDTDDPGSTSLSPLYWRGYTTGNFSNSVATQINMAGTGVTGTTVAGGGYDSTTDRTLMLASGNTGDFAIYGTAVVPEPSAWTFGIMGLGLLGLRLRLQEAPDSAS